MNFMNRRSQCKECKLTFVRSSETQVYCTACLTDAYYQELFRKKTHTNACEFCGMSFETQMPDRNTCSAVCRIELAKIKTPNQVPTSHNPYSAVDLRLQQRSREAREDLSQRQFDRYIKGSKWDM